MSKDLPLGKDHDPTRQHLIKRIESKLRKIRSREDKKKKNE